MLSDILPDLMAVTALGCGIIGGVFFAFSAFVLKALARLPSAQGIAAMQSINVAVLNPWFLGVFLGTAALCGLIAAIHFRYPISGYALSGCALYLVGTFGVTIFGNVPLNNRLGTFNPHSMEAEVYWKQYTATWIMWNHVRTFASLAACALIMAPWLKR